MRTFDAQESLTGVGAAGTLRSTFHMGQEMTVIRRLAWVPFVFAVLAVSAITPSPAGVPPTCDDPGTLIPGVRYFIEVWAENNTGTANLTYSEGNITIGG